MQIDLIPPASGRWARCATGLRRLAGARYTAVVATSDSRRIHGEVLDNAVKYTPRCGSVTVRLEQAGGWYRIAVTDTGSGIPPEAQPRVFERFFRVNKADSRAESISDSTGGGAGLGLSIALSIHRGTLALDGPMRAAAYSSLRCPALRRQESGTDALG